MMHEVILMRIALWLALLIPMALWALKDVILLRPPFSPLRFFAAKGTRESADLAGERADLCGAVLFCFAQRHAGRAPRLMSAACRP